MGLGGFLCGLVGDADPRRILGEQALRLTIFTFIVLRLRPAALFPMWQQGTGDHRPAGQRPLVICVTGCSSLASRCRARPGWRLVVGAWWFLLLDDLRARRACIGHVAAARLKDHGRGRGGAVPPPIVAGFA